MRLRQKGEPKDDGRYALPRDTLISLLKENGVSVIKDEDEDEDEGYLFKKDFKVNYQSLLPIVPSRVVFLLANYFNILPDNLYRNVRILPRSDSL